MKRTPAMLRRAVAEYLDCGSKSEAARRIGVDEGTIRNWEARPEWAETEARLLEEIEEEHKASFRSVLAKGIKAAEDRLENGDTVVQGGQRYSVPVRARDCAIIASIAYDKLRLANGMPTRITADTGAAGELMRRFEEMGRAYREGNVLSVLPEPSQPIDSKGKQG